MKKVSKKEIREAVEASIQQTLTKFDIAAPSKKTKKLVASVSKKVSGRIRTEVKKLTKKAVKATSQVRNGKHNEKLVAA